jgi:hypothetical protein
LELAATFRADRHARPRAAPKSDRPIGEPPGHLAPDEAACWRDFVRDLPGGVSATLREQVGSERARAAQAEAERDAARAEREAAKVAAAEAAGEARGLREALAEARRPFWRRWLG